jgi:hypothetical protein
MATLKKYVYYIGIDPGVHTGFAVWDKINEKLQQVLTLKIHQAMLVIKHDYCDSLIWENTFVRVEDPRMATYLRGDDMQKAQGAGSVKRDASIWEDFLTDLGIPFEMVRPNKRSTKLNGSTFKRITGFSDKTSVHGRDAAMLVYGK